MKNTFLLAFAITMAASIHAQTPQKAPVNQSYLHYLAGETPTNNYGYLPPVVDLKAKKYPAEKSTLVLPPSYDLRTQGYLTSVKNQGSCGSCWTFATCAATESYWLLSGAGSFDLSEDNINNCHNFDWAPCMGGNIFLSTAYLSRGSGMISEADDPFNDVAGTCPTGLNPLKYVTESRFLPQNNTSIKQAVYDYGALYTCFYWESAYFNSSNNTYYYSGSDNPNHAVTIVGWDDNKATSGGTGAWIIKNSWGASWGESGYFYISYNDASVNEEVGYFPGYKNFTIGDYVMTYAPFGEINDIGFGSNTGYGVIKYSASGNMMIKSIGSYIASGNSTVGFEIYDDFNGITLSNLIDSIGTKSCDLPGYSTFDLNTPLVVVSGNDLYIKVKYVTPSYNYPIPVEEVYSGYASNVTTETGKCWVSSNGTTWQAAGAGTSRDYDICLNLYASAAGAVSTSFVANTTTTCTGEIAFSDQSSNSPTNWLWNFGDGNTSTLQNPTHFYIIDGNYTVKLKAWNIFGTDSLTRPTYISVGLPTSPSTIGDTVCAGQQATLSANGTGIIEWYDAATGGNFLGSGNTYTTPIATSTTNYYAQNSGIPGTSLYVGDTHSSSNGSMFTSSVQHYLVFDCQEACKLVSVQVNAGASGYRLIELQDNAGNVLQDTNINISSGVSRITLNFDIPVGTSLRLAGPLSPNLYRNNTGCNYPYELLPYISINESSAGTTPTGYYYYFYDWEVKGYCTSARTPVMALVDGPSTALSISGLYQLCPGDSVEVTASNADSWLWSPNGEATQSITVNSAGNYFATLTGSACNSNSDTLMVVLAQLPVAGFNWLSNGSNVQFTSTAQNASSYYYDFGDGSSSTSQNPSHIYSTSGSFVVVQYAINACDSAMSIDTIQVVISGILNSTPNSMVVFPNPATENITVTYQSGNVDWMRILNPEGIEIMRIVNLGEQSTIVDISALKPGIYFIEINGTDNMRTVFVKM